MVDQRQQNRAIHLAVDTLPAGGERPRFFPRTARDCTKPPDFCFLPFCVPLSCLQCFWTWCSLFPRLAGSKRCCVCRASPAGKEHTLRAGALSAFSCTIPLPASSSCVLWLAHYQIGPQQLSMKQSSSSTTRNEAFSRPDLFMPAQHTQQDTPLNLVRRSQS